MACPLAQVFPALIGFSLFPSTFLGIASSTFTTIPHPAGHPEQVVA